MQTSNVYISNTYNNHLTNYTQYYRVSENVLMVINMLAVPTIACHSSDYSHRFSQM